VPGEQFGGGSVIVTVGAAGAGHQLVRALHARGVDAIAVTTSTDDSRSDLAALFALASPGRPLGAVVHTHVTPDSLRPATLDSLSDADWDDRCEAQIRHAIHVFQAAFDAFGPIAGPGTAPRRLVAVVPTIAILGAEELIPLATTAEGIRSLVRSTARQWGANGITINTVAVPSASLAIGAPPGPTVAVASLPAADDPVQDLAEAVATLLGPAGAVMNGQTLIVDRGTVMV
jgi:NAD(P)-dependent dehydrogenase (short-subunit alcohol dehydrogenase family)